MKVYKNLRLDGIYWFGRLKSIHFCENHGPWKGELPWKKSHLNVDIQPWNATPIFAQRATGVIGATFSLFPGRDVMISDSMGFTEYTKKTTVYVKLLPQGRDIRIT